MRLRIRFEDKTFTVSLNDSATLHDLQVSIKNLTNRNDLKILHRFPLVELDCTHPQKTLQELGIESAETITCEPHNQIVQLTRGIAAPTAPKFKPCMVLREIPDDNSCLFNAIGYVLEHLCLYKAEQLREKVAQYILDRPLEYTAALLGKEPREYANWIRKRNTWGGAIELAIFSDIYGVQIGSFDVQTGRMDLFGEGRSNSNTSSNDRSFTKRVYLQYTGIHYEAFAMAHSDSQADDVTIFESSDVTVLEQVRQLVEVARAAHRYTDLAKFTIKCNDCNIGLNGQLDTQKHANSFGHFNFSEY